MIKAKGDAGDGEMIMLGLAEENLVRLRKGEPILIKKAEMGLPHDILIFWGKDHRALVDMIRDGIGSDTEMHIGTMHGGAKP